MTETELLARLKEAAADTERALEEALSPVHTGDTVIGEAMRYATLGGGKRIRAFLVLTCAELCGGTREAALPFACAIECVHAYSLIHDDLPCMDNDPLRRGKPSCHVAFGEAEALLAGDALLTYAFEAAASNPFVSPESAAAAVNVLASEAGPRGMVRGQAIDMKSEMKDLDELADMYAGKTAALLRASCLLGLFAAPGKPDPAIREKLEEYAYHIGLAFQIRDDILDVTSDTETLGKAVGSDEKNDKKTVFAFMELEEADARVRSHTETACRAVADIPGSGILAALALWLAERKK